MWKHFGGQGQREETYTWWQTPPSQTGRDFVSENRRVQGWGCFLQAAEHKRGRGSPRLGPWLPSPAPLGDAHLGWGPWSLQASSPQGLLQKSSEGGLWPFSLPPPLAPEPKIAPSPTSHCGGGCRSVFLTFWLFPDPPLIQAAPFGLALCGCEQPSDSLPATSVPGHLEVWALHGKPTLAQQSQPSLL